MTVGCDAVGSADLQQSAQCAPAIERAVGVLILSPPPGKQPLTAMLDRLDGVLFPDGSAAVDPRAPRTVIQTHVKRLIHGYRAATRSPHALLNAWGLHKRT